MKHLNWISAKKVLSNKNDLGLHLLFIFMIIYIVSTGGDHLRTKLFLIFAGLSLVVLFVKKITQPLLWYVFLTIILSDLLWDYFGRANHHFLMIYITILVIIFLQNSNEKDLFVNIKLLMAIVLLFSGIQKLLSPQFISGDYFYYMINSGKFFKPFLHFNQDVYDTIIFNNAQISELSKLNPHQSNTVKLQNIIPHLDVISQVYAWFSIAMEVITGIMILWKPKLVFTHILFILLILGIFFTRLENGFMALLAICGIWLTSNYIFRAVYMLLTIVFLSLMITKIGFY